MSGELVYLVSVHVTTITSLRDILLFKIIIIADSGSTIKWEWDWIKKAAREEIASINGTMNEKEKKKLSNAKRVCQFEKCNQVEVADRNFFWQFKNYKNAHNTLKRMF